jgi:hypothetical protein
MAREKNVVESSNENSFNGEVVVLLARKFRKFLKINKLPRTLRLSIPRVSPRRHPR